VFPPLRDAVTESPTEQARRFFYDTLVFDAPLLRHLVATFGADRLLVGTDYPFNFHERTPLARLREAGFDADSVARLAHLNAATFLGLSSGTPS
jgi:aminocarboxymuconate-semialdehyde decarboxylase